MKTNQTLLLLAGFVLALFGATSCSKKSGNSGTPVTPPDTTTTPVVSSQVAFWLTNPDKSALLQKQNVALNFSNGLAIQPVITSIRPRPFRPLTASGMH